MMAFSEARIVETRESITVPPMRMAISSTTRPAGDWRNTEVTMPPLGFSA